MFSLCRLCAKYTTATELITEIVNLEPKLSFCCGWKRSENEEQMPQKACNLCVDKVEQSWTFAESIRKADNHLKKLANECAPEVCVKPHSEVVIVESIQFGTDDNSSDSEEILKAPNDNSDFNGILEQSNPSSENSQQKTMNDTTEVTKIDEYFRFLSSLNDEDRLADGTISTNAVAKLESLFPEIKKISWNQCKYKCKICDTDCKSPQNFFVHNRSFHLEEVPKMAFFCFYCDAKHIREHDLNRHLTEHFPHLKFSCYYCTDYFWDISELVKHRSMHTDVEYKCDICDRILYDRYGFQRHIAMFHLNKKILDPDKKFTCEICNNDFPSKWKIRIHMSNHAKTYNQPNEHEENLLCEQCGQNFSTQARLFGHVISAHSDETPFECTECDKRFKTKHALQYHTLGHGDMILCSECGKTFRSKYKLKEHMILHTNEYPYSCEFCNKKFQLKMRLKSHRIIHTNEKPYTCDQCEYKCTTSSKLKKHKNRSHCEDSERDASCRKVKVYKMRRSGDFENFRKLYRFDPDNVNYLINCFMPSYDESRGGALTNEQKMKIFLRYVGDPGFQANIGEDLGFHQSTVSKTVWQVCNFILEKAEEWIQFPKTVEEFEKAKSVWRNKYTFPYAIGAIDCTSIPIQKPKVQPNDYKFRKHFAIKIQATCDANDLFTSVNCTWPGSVSDADIWSNSELESVLNGNTCGALLLADNGYPLTPWLMTKFRNPQNDQQHSYNEIHNTERYLIERMFSRLKQRFQILFNKIRMATERIPSIVLACFVLHNVAKFLHDPDFENEIEDMIEEDDENVIVIQNDKNMRARGASRRIIIANSITDIDFV